MATWLFTRRKSRRRALMESVAGVLLLIQGTVHAQVYPNPPQSGITDGIETLGARIPAGNSGFVDPLSFGYCRYVTNADSHEVYVPIANATEWLYFRWGEVNQSTPPGVSEQVCCRPSTGADNPTLCNGATGGTKTPPIVGSGVNGYGVLGQIGTATATCHNPPYGDYVETQTFTCGQIGTGANADGQWGGEIADNPGCATATPYTTYGGCSQSCSNNGSVGYELRTVYDACGDITHQAYDGPQCGMQSCCTDIWEKSYCSGSTGVYTNAGTCPTHTKQSLNACILSISTYTYGCDVHCTPHIATAGGNGCTYIYHDCYANWPPRPPGAVCTLTTASFSWHAVGSKCVGDLSGENKLPSGAACTCRGTRRIWAWR